jgi:hypothetical protein
MSFLVIFLIFLFLERKSQRQMGLENEKVSGKWGWSEAKAPICPLD